MHLPDWKGVEGTAGWETSSSKQNVKEQMREEGKRCGLASREGHVPLAKALASTRLYPLIFTDLTLKCK